MIWQDTAIMVLQFIIALALVPTVINRHKPAVLTSAIDGGALVCLAIVFATMGYWLSMLGAIISAGLWFTLLVQVILLKRRGR